MNTTPKARFLADEKMARMFLDVVDSMPFERACELAMLALLEQLTESTDPSTAAANAYRLDGARRFLATLKALPEPPKPLAPRPSHNLDHALK